MIIHRLKYRNFPGMLSHKVLDSMRQKGLKVAQIEPYLLDLGLNSKDIDEMKHIEEKGYYSTHGDRGDTYCMSNLIIDSINANSIQDLGSSDRVEKECICACGTPMKLKRLKRDYVHPNFCHCGERMGYFIINNGSLIYECEDKECGLCHSAQQEDIIYPMETLLRKKGEPLGIPCSAECKKWRLNLHQVLDDYIKRERISKSGAYDVIAKILDLPRELAHVASLNIEQCSKVIRILSVQPQI